MWSTEVWTVIGQVIVSLGALWAAVVSTLNLVRNIRQDSRRLNVRLSWGLLANRAMPDNDEKLIVNIGNPGSIPVVISGITLRFPGNKTFVQLDLPGNATLPHELEAGKGCAFWYELKHLKEKVKESEYGSSVRVHALVSDQVGGEHRSQKFKIDLSS